MYLKSLTLKGFKSFADRTTMTFDPGLTVVVGPNGSGKSNISDAILWVLGEQSAKMLRGQAMEDVIFSGSSARQPVGVAEVTLTLDNSDRTLPIEFSEVAVTRRMYRSGESEYLINAAPSRLMDITDILHDSGLGRETHSIISQGKLDSILSSRPEERRALIEEAAGIAKHRRRKARAERKLRSMGEHLTRAKDIAREINRQLKPLERQVDKARRSRDLHGRLKDLTAALAVDDLRQLQGRFAQLTARQREADSAIELAQYRLHERRSSLERYQSLLEQKGIFVGDLGEQRRRMQDLLGRMDSDMRLLEEKGKNMVSRLSEMRMSLSSGERQRAEVARELERVSEGLRDARVRADELQARLDGLVPEAERATELRRDLGSRQAQLTAEARAAQREADAETLAYAKLRDQLSNAEVEDQMFVSRLDQLTAQLETADEALAERTARKGDVSRDLEAAAATADAAEGAIRSAQAALSQARLAEGDERVRLQEAQASLHALEAVDAQGANASELAAALASDQDAPVECRLADLIEAPADLEGLVERLLGDALAALVVPDADAVSTLALRAESLGSTAGKATIVPRSPVTPDRAQVAPGEPLVDRLRVPAAASALAQALLGGVRLVESAEGAVRAHGEEPSLTYVAPSGVTALPDGRVVVGSEAGVERGALERKRRMRALRGSLADLERSFAQATAAASDAEVALLDARDRSARAKGDVARLRGELSSITSEIARLEAQRNQASSEHARVSKRRAEATRKRKDALPQIERHHGAAQAAERRAGELGQQLEEVLRERSEASRAEGDARARLADARLQLATIVERRNHLAVREEQLTRQKDELDRRREVTERASRALDVLRLRVDPLHERYEALYARATEWAERLRDRASLAEADSDSLKATIREAREAADAASAELERAKGAATDLKVDLGRIEVQVESAVKAITDEGWVLEEALALPEPEDRESMERAAAQLRRQIEGIGPVNEVALEEYQRLKRRSDYIAGQVSDLEAASKSLAKITAAIERKMRRQFLVVFDRVNANFSELFGMLFPGGRAHIEMTDPDHVSETGIEIVAQPRGKRIQKMMLMSGGEKSLTALALLFAVYRARTVPFYVFDEVEAALDDSNLSRLLDAIEQLKGSTQLIVISHQRRTMEQADVLYGVSMQADGVSHVVSQRLDQSTGKVVEA